MKQHIKVLKEMSNLERRYLRTGFTISSLKYKYVLYNVFNNNWPYQRYFFLLLFLFIKVNNKNLIPIKTKEISQIKC